MPLEEKILLITGASDGIGRAIARQAASEGATVIIHGKTLPKLERLYDEIVEAGHREPLIYPLDFEKATPDDFSTMQKAIDDAFGHLDALINNAGWLGASSPMQQYDIALWHRVVQINLNAPFMLTRACLPLLNRARQANIIFTVDNKRSAYWGAYGVAKSAQQAMMKILHDELDKTSIRINAIDPGAVRTSFRTRAFPGEDPNRNKTPEQVAPCYLDLVRDQTGARNGEEISLETLFNDAETEPSGGEAATVSPSD